MNLSQILNPPGSSAISNRQGRTSSPPPPPSSSLPPPSLSSSTAVLRFDTPFNGNTGGGATRKHSSSVSVPQLEEQATSSLHTSSSGKASTGTYQRIKANEVNNGYSTHTFRANAPIQSSKEISALSTSTATNSASLTSIAPNGGTVCQLVMSHNTPKDMSSSISTAKKKRRNNASSISESLPFQDSFQSNPSEQHETTSSTTTTIINTTAASTPSTTIKKKAPKKINPTQENESLPIEIRFVMSDKDDQDKQRSQKQTSVSTPKDDSTTQDSPGEDSSNQESFQPSPTPDYEKNADGKFRCSWPRCGKEFTVSSRLTTHYRIHSGKPPYLCGYKDCQKAFHTSSSLSHHRVVHTDQNLRPYVCRHNRCGATYTQLARLITHQRTTHSGMILFIPQESSSSVTSSPSYSHGQTPSQSATVTPTGTPRNDPSSPSISLPSTPSGHAASGSTFVATGSVSPPMSEPTNRNNESVHQKNLNSTRDPASTNRQDGPISAQSNHTASRLPTTSNGSIMSGVNAHKNGHSRNYSADQEQRSAQGRDKTREDTHEIVEKEDSDEMRLKEEAALTMTSFREMAMLQQQHTQPKASPTPFHPSHQQQAPPNANAHHYPSSEYYYAQSSYRDYPPDSYNQHSSNTPFPPNHSATSTGSHTQSPSHSEDYWDNNHRGVTSKQEANGYIHPGQGRVHNPLQSAQNSTPHSSDNRYHHFPPHPPRSCSPSHQETQYRGHTNDHGGYDRQN